ncbi:hypothetical protein [Marinobacter shengliensis]|uniref:hypothetical protein n=1 Tax=Marinobacter shengliensis TaxID=1389223 RepID=UPI001BB1CED3|nr:hypothetical protein [Marinobacter shengliensis]
MADEKKVMDDENQGRKLATAFRKHNLPTTEEVKALDGKIFAMLTERETHVFDFFRMYGRKHGVAIQVKNEADPDALARATSKAQADEIMKSANCRVHVIVQ